MGNRGALGGLLPTESAAETYSGRRAGPGGCPGRDAPVRPARSRQATGSPSSLALTRAASQIRPSPWAPTPDGPRIAVGRPPGCSDDAPGESGRVGHAASHGGRADRRAPGESRRVEGARNAQLAAGGDLVAIGEPEPGRPWRIGIRHPDLPRDTAAHLDITDLAVATSGRDERGAHIRDPRTGEVPSELRSVTVIGPELALSDAFATAALARGERGLSWIARQPGFGAVGITCDDRVVWTPVAVALRARTSGR